MYKFVSFGILLSKLIAVQFVQQFRKRLVEIIVLKFTVHRTLTGTVEKAQKTFLRIYAKATRHIALASDAFQGCLPDLAGRFSSH